ncbi:MBL fold metallo-hydrolase [Devosia sp. A8/3-2]|nr:MBL fold metallo-hydrolase [Devosia sp. A8/3-2]
MQRREALKAEINTATARGGNLVIPAFAVERSRELLHDIGYLIKTGEIDPRSVFLDSPLASKVTGVYRKYAKMFDDVELGADELFNDPRFRIIEAVEDSKAINAIRGGAIIMSASGMADAGRIKHHLRNNLIRANATVLFVGYQAPGTLGQIILSGAKEVRIHGTLVPVRASIRSMGNYSAHADHSELMARIKARLPAHGAIFLTHGEDEERTALRAAVMATGLSGDQIILPQLDDYFELTAAGISAKARPATPASIRRNCRPIGTMPFPTSPSASAGPCRPAATRRNWPSCAVCSPNCRARARRPRRGMCPARSPRSKRRATTSSAHPQCHPRESGDLRLAMPGRKTEVPAFAEMTRWALHLPLPPHLPRA